MISLPPYVGIQLVFKDLIAEIAIRFLLVLVRDMCSCLSNTRKGNAKVRIEVRSDSLQTTTNSACPHCHDEPDYHFIFECYIDCSPTIFVFSASSRMPADCETFSRSISTTHNHCIKTAYVPCLNGHQLYGLHFGTNRLQVFNFLNRVKIIE